MGEKAPVPVPKAPMLPFKPLEFDWLSPNLNTQFKLFRAKCDYAFKGTYSDNTKEVKVGAILNWLRDNACEIHSNFNWTAPTAKNDPDKVLDEFKQFSNQHTTNTTHGTP